MTFTLKVKDLVLCPGGAKRIKKHEGWAAGLSPRRTIGREFSPEPRNYPLWKSGLRDSSPVIILASRLSLTQGAEAGAGCSLKHAPQRGGEVWEAATEKLPSDPSPPTPACWTIHELTTHSFWALHSVPLVIYVCKPVLLYPIITMCPVIYLSIRWCVS